MKRLKGLLLAAALVTALATVKAQEVSPVSFMRMYPQGIEPCGAWIVPLTAFDSFDMMPFEDSKFSVTHGYDVFLRNGYGDYMQLPPEDQRENRHNIIEVKL